MLIFQISVFFFFLIIFLSFFFFQHIPCLSCRCTCRCACSDCTSLVELPRACTGFLSHVSCNTDCTGLSYFYLSSPSVLWRGWCRACMKKIPAGHLAFYGEIPITLVLHIKATTSPLKAGGSPYQTDLYVLSCWALSVLQSHSGVHVHHLWWRWFMN